MSPERLSIRYEVEKKEVLREMAERHNTTLSNLIRTTLEKIIEYERKGRMEKSK